MQQLGGRVEVVCDHEPPVERTLHGEATEVGHVGHRRLPTRRRGHAGALLIFGGALSLFEVHLAPAAGSALELVVAAVIAGLVERRHIGSTKNSRQLSVSSNLIYDVLRRHDPHHLLLEAAYRDAATGLLDIGRLAAFLTRIKGRIRHSSLLRVSPLAVPLILELGREAVHGSSAEALLKEAAEALIAEALETDLEAG